MRNFINRNSIIINISVFVKRFFIFFSIIIAQFSEIHSQEITYSDPYSEKIIFNPSFSGLSECSEVNLTYNKSFTYDFYSTTYNQFFEKYNSGIGIIFSNLNQAKGAINNLKTELIYTYKLSISENKILNTAFQIGYFNQHINTSQLIFNSQINPLNGTISQNTEELFFDSFQIIDFSFGSSFLSNNIRTGISIHHLDKIFYTPKINLLKPDVKVHFGKIFSVKNNSVKKYIDFYTPEIIYEYQNNFHQIYYGIHLINNIFLTRIFIKHNINFNSISGIFSIGLIYKNIRISYTYSIALKNYIALPINSNQLSLKYNFNCKKKRNTNNTINCLNI